LAQVPHGKGHGGWNHKTAKRSEAANPPGGAADGLGHSLRHYTAKDGLASSLILAIHVDHAGTVWVGTSAGLDRLRDLAELGTTSGIAISDFALDRQSRWREAIASIFDDPDFTPYLRSIRRIAVTYATHDETGSPGSTNVVKPVYHVAWIASCLGLRVVKPLHPVAAPAGAAKRKAAKPQLARGLAAQLSDGRGDVAVVVRPVTSPAPAGTTLRVELLAERRSSELRADVTAEQDVVRVRVWQDGVEALDRSFNAARRTDVDLLAQAIEASGRNRIAAKALAAAAALVGPPDDAA